MERVFTVSEEEGITWVRFHGKPGLDDIVAAMHEVARRNGPTDRIWDFSAGLNLGGDLLRQISEHSRRILPMEARVAFISPDALSFGLTRAYTVYREQSDLALQVFASEAEALGWLRGHGDGAVFRRSDTIS